MLQFSFVFLTLFMEIIFIKYTYKNNKLFRRIFYFVITLWTILILFSLTSRVNTLQLSLKTTCLLCLGNLSICFGYCLFSYKEIQLKKLELKNTKIHILFKITNLEILFRGIQIILLLVFGYYFIRYEALLNELGIEMARLIKFQLGLLFCTKIESYIFQYILTGLLSISIFYYVINFFESNYKIIDYVLLVFNIVLFSFIGKGRMIYFQIIITLLFFVYKYISVDINFIKRFYKPMIIIFISLIVFLFVMTFLRMGMSVNSLYKIPEYFNRTISQIYLYFTGPFKGLDYYINCNIDKSNFLPGNFTFFVVFQPFIKLLSLLNFNISFENPMVFLQQSIYLSEYTSFNALYTYYINFYMDFSYLGFIIMPLVLGYFMALFVKQFESNNTIIKIFAYFNFISIIMGILRWEYQNYDVIFSLIFLLIIYFFYSGEKNVTNY